MLFENKNRFISTIDFAAACDFVKKFHEHNDPPIGHLFSLALWEQTSLIGVAIVGRPIGYKLQDGRTVEILRNCVKRGHPNACSMLYGACIRMAFKKGYNRVFTYTKMSENGASLKASNFLLDKINVGGKKWTGKRKYVCKSQELKKRWVYYLK